MAVSKCGLASVRLGYSIFALTLGGYCITGSNALSDYQYYPARLCSNGRGGYDRSWYLLDVYQVSNQRSFSDSAVQVINGTTSAPITSNVTGTPTDTPSSANSTISGAAKYSSGQKFTFSITAIIVAVLVTMAL